MRGHTKDQCFKIHGYPDWFKNGKSKGDGKYAGNVGSNTSIGDDFMQDTTLDSGNYFDLNRTKKTDNQMLNIVVKEVMKAMNQKQQPGDSSGSRVKLSNFAGIISTSNACSYYEVFDKQSCIIDSWASDHMASCSSLFTDLKNLKKHMNVGMPDGTIRNVKQMGTIVLDPHIV